MQRRRLGLIASLVVATGAPPPEWAARATTTEAPVHVVVNIPAFRLEVWSHDTLLRVMPVAVGMRNFKSPRGAFEITSIEWNPWWIPPDHPWAAGQKPTPPGPANPMGRVKLNFRPLYFLHGSPLEGSIGTSASHGCIRLKNADAIALATLVLHAGSPRLTDAELSAMAASGATRLIELDEAVGLDMRYDRVVVRSDSIFIYQDIYKLSARSLRDEVVAVLDARGPDVSVNVAAVDAFTSRVPAAGKGIAIRELVVRQSPTRKPERR